MREEIKSRLELIPIFLLLESMVCFLLSYFDIYADIFGKWEELTECSLLMCIILYGISEDWGLLSKKCLITLVILNLLNLLFDSTPPDKYYFYFQSIIYSSSIFLIIHELCRKK